MNRKKRQSYLLTPKEKGTPIVFPPGRPGRNEKCHCQSGKKYKACCLQSDELGLIGKA